jgi:5-methylcytosine-specific restriction endonuclease McrA
MNKNFSEKTKETIFERDNYCCVLCGSCINIEKVPHHVFYRSELHREIVKDPSNGVCICISCHEAVTNKTPDNGGKEKDKQLKRQSIEWFRKNRDTSADDMRTLEALYRARYGRL